MARRALVITDLTRMQDERVCLAGYPVDLAWNEAPVCVRPDFRYGVITEPWLFSHGRVIVRPFAVVGVDLIEHRPRPPHTEDWAIDERVRVARWAYDDEERHALLTHLDDGSVVNIFGAPIVHEGRWWVTAGTGVRSLGTIQPSRVVGVVLAPKVARNGWDYRIAFDDVASDRYDLAVTDLAFRFALDHRRDWDGQSPSEIADTTLNTLQAAKALFLRIGLTRGFPDRPDRCYLQITGVYSFPDYLGGRCFADFPAYQERLSRRNNLDGVPF